MIYQEFPPHPALRAHVACLWMAGTLGARAPVTHQVLPDNCVDILWQDGGAPGFAVGMMSRPITVASSGLVRTVAVRFKPGAAGLFLGLPLRELTDQRADIDLLWGRGAAERLAEHLWQPGCDDGARLALLQDHLLRRLRDGGGAAGGPGARLARAALAGLDGSGGTLGIAALAGQLGVSRQHLATQFLAHVGLPPKLYARIRRFRRATEALRQRDGTPDWTRLALDCGYFDQSHLIHDFQEFAASTPHGYALAR